MRTHAQQMRSPITRKHEVLRVAPLFLAIFTILAILMALAQEQGAGQLRAPSSSSTHKIAGANFANIPSLLPAVSYDSGGVALMSVAVADLNRDGKSDVAVTNWCSNSSNCIPYTWGGSGSVAVLLGNGDGTLQAAVAYASGGTNPVSVAIADVNGDRMPDLVVANQCADGTNCAGGGSVGVLLGKGNGTFQVAKSYNSGGYLAQSVAIADLNGDGKPDVAVVNWSQTNVCSLGTCTVGVLLGNGDGTFQAAVNYSAGGSGGSSIAATDVNGDGRADLLVIAGETVGVLLGNGDGTFRPVVTYDTGAVSPVSLVSADLNGEGRPDLVIGHVLTCVQSACTDGPVGVLAGNGDGTFRPAVIYDVTTAFPIASSSYPVAVADMNGDGKPDLVVGGANSNNIAALPGNGDGTFQSAAIYSSGDGFPAGAVAAADLNGDGKPDLVVGHVFANGSSEGLVSILLNNTPFKNSTTTTLTSSLNPSIYGQKLTFAATVTSSGSIPPTGTVRLTWSIYTIDRATLSSGVATFTKSELHADTIPLTAVYVGDAANHGSTSAILTQVVTQATSTATLTSSPNPSTKGQAVTFTATISSPTVTPTGPVTFTAENRVLGTAQLSGGKAIFTTSSLFAGSTTVTATYYGDSNIAKSAASVIQTVQN
ncbi:MAG: hypothetical protein DMG77_03095 [Acidobacteria bacterium]|nr:MAG: hypothetical protein DMG77_03095 [Acidobacteriota bacterium]